MSIYINIKLSVNAYNYYPNYDLNARSKRESIIEQKGSVEITSLFVIK